MMKGERGGERERERERERESQRDRQTHTHRGGQGRMDGYGGRNGC